MRILHIPDANTESASSPGSTGDANQGAPSSSAQTPPDPTDVGASLTDIVLKTAEKHAGAPKDGAGAEGSESGSIVEPDKPKDQVEGVEDPSAKGTEEAKADETTGAPKEPPFHQHPRWQEKVAEVNTLKDEVEKLRPMAEAQESIANYLNDAGVTPQEFHNALEIAALLKTDPAQALEKLKPIVQALGYNGDDSLPKDLAEKVEQGKMALEDAKEMQRLRQDAEHAKTRGATAAANRTRDAHIAKLRALGDWEASTAKQNPDYRPKLGPNDPDGVYELTAMKFQQLLATAPPRSPQEMTAMAQRAYESAIAIVKRFTPKAKPTGKVLQTKSSSGANNATEQPKTIQDVVFATAAKHGL